MTIAYFLTIKNSEADGPALRRRFEADAVPGLLERTEIDCVSLFAPEQSDDPYADDGAPPDMVVQISVADMESLEKLFSDAEIRRHFEAPGGATASCEVFESLSYAIDGITEPGFRSAPVSFNVRYYGPVADARHFVDHYLEHHPRILAELPGIRNVFCYLPTAWSNPTGVPDSGCILGNEVVFESVQALNDALASDVRHALREDYLSFPVRPGPNTHFAMQRTDFRRRRL